MACSASRVSRWAAIAEKPLKSSYSGLSPCTARSLAALPKKEMTRCLQRQQLFHVTACWNQAAGMDTWCLWVRHCFHILKLGFIILNWSGVISRELYVPLWLPRVTVHADNPLLLQLKQMANFPLALMRQECPTAPSALGRDAWDTCYSQGEGEQPPLLWSGCEESSLTGTPAQSLALWEDV